jgi:hypothetical protein
MRAGTENLYGIIGFAKALELATNNFEKDRAYISGLKMYMHDQLKENIKDLHNDDHVFAAIYDRDEADEFIENNEEKKSPLTDREWLQIVNKMHDDEVIWEELQNSFRYYLDQVLTERRKNDASVSQD